MAIEKLAGTTKRRGKGVNPETARSLSDCLRLNKWREESGADGFSDNVEMMLTSDSLSSPTKEELIDGL